MTLTSRAAFIHSTIRLRYGSCSLERGLEHPVANLVIAVYRPQVDACAEAGPALLASSSTPHAAPTGDLQINTFPTRIVTLSRIRVTFRVSNHSSGPRTVPGLSIKPGPWRQTAH